MAEWLKAHAWKACLGETLTWVRIPLSPPQPGWCTPAILLKHRAQNVKQPVSESHCVRCRRLRLEHEEEIARKHCGQTSGPRSLRRCSGQKILIRQTRTRRHLLPSELPSTQLCR